MAHYKHMIARGLLGRKIKMTKRGMQFIARGSGVALKKLTDEQFNNKFSNQLTTGRGVSSQRAKSIKPLKFKF